jgi:hypothetical protein
MTRTLATLTTFSVLGLVAAWGGPQQEVRKKLDPEAVSVRLLLGVGDAEPGPWNGSVKVDRGQVVGVENWRLRQGDEITGADSWKAKSLLIRKVAAKKAVANAKKAAALTPAEKKAQAGPGTAGPTVAPGGVVATLKGADSATMTLTTDAGKADIKLTDLADGSPHRFLDNKVEARLVPPSLPVASGPRHEDFPAAAADPKGNVWLAYVEHEARGSEVSEALTEAPKDFSNFVPQGGGDQIKLLKFADGSPGEAFAVTEPGRDVWRPAIAVDGQGKVVVAWSEFQDGNWDIYRRVYDPSANSFGESRRLTTAAGADTAVALATAPGGQVWMAWQAWNDGQADIKLARVEAPGQAFSITETAANEWSPALAIGPDGAILVAYDTYESGNYDVKLVRWVPRVGRSRALTIAGSSRFEARPSVAVDAKGRAWVAYEERDAQWGKDAENLVDGEGSSLYRSSTVKVACLDGDTLRFAPDPVAGAPMPERRMNSFPRLAVDGAGRVWLMFRHRDEVVWGNNAVMVVGGVWLSYATALGEKGWSAPRPLANSDNLLDNRPALVAVPDGPVLAFHSSDGRLRREVEMNPERNRRYYTHSGTPPGVVNNDIFVAALAAKAGPAVSPALRSEPVEAIAAEPPVHPTEADDVARMRAHRINAGGKTYQLLRGEFHRHTEISQDGGSDGALEDMWRYAIDAGDLDWIGNGDHDNGGGKEYTWWLIQKSTDLYHNPGVFMPMFTYERSVAYPGGHRNVMFPKRGVRTLPRLIDDNGVRLNNRAGQDEDAAMLFAYLNQLGGICASHTSATGMGTDWRANDPKAEPIVEIFQGHRQSYEYLGAPRSARRAEESIGGWRPLGMVWNALGLQYRLGFQASSDHISTHISLAIALAERPTREAIFDAFRQRHCYAATDNILLDVRCGEHLMGDEFDASGPVTLKVLAHGTGPIERVDIIKDFVFAYSVQPGKQRVAFEWTDDEKRLGLSWYYVRAIQKDGQLAWGSPMWIRTAAP